MRRRLIAVALAAAVGAGSWALVSTAGAETSVPASSSAVSSTAVYIYPSLALISAEVGRAGSTARRRFDAYHTAVFVQSWIGVAISGTVKHVPLSAGVSIYRVDATGTWNGAGEVSTRTIFYASDGRRVVGRAASVLGNARRRAVSWWLAPERVNGRVRGHCEARPDPGDRRRVADDDNCCARSHGRGESFGGRVAGGRDRGRRRRSGRGGGRAVPASLAADEVRAITPSGELTRAEVPCSTDPQTLTAASYWGLVAVPTGGW